ncbi:putative cytochrome b-domain protein [Leishmania major strain Friedlin]|uniref:Putative cytochrome b-domain protein n=1 Tax=Leishmania major TaxID=5664 RepID=E9AC79_LEIMA|nr:putative cytochrome b-domain protein [Leishmania major strain Friedlin]CAG9567154.1 cytochrome_b-domain_protein_-_putative [Leishmania major strain Friedlin]CBZ11893.1 putative cytochrome b-domain protein [Leishmania major strain Friedlin]|eukprot:XP_003721610.1 putative cytochrome b-domain protein [Leishmania major strain Friedlin]
MPTFYTRDQVAEHNKKKSGWLIINNGVYDVSDFYDDHPGGRDILLAHIGTDATEGFEAVNHSKGAVRKLDKLKVGELPENERRRYISMEQVAAKKSADSAWFVINNKVYDVTPFLDLHPGGRDILLYNAGGDATQAFTDNGHSDTAYEMMGKYVVGDVEPSERKTLVNRKATRTTQAATTEMVCVKSENASLLAHIQEQLKLLMALALFVIAGVFLLS